MCGMRGRRVRAVLTHSMLQSGGRAAATKRQQMSTMSLQRTAVCVAGKVWWCVRVCIRLPQMRKVARAMRYGENGHNGNAAGANVGPVAVLVVWNMYSR